MVVQGEFSLQLVNAKTMKPFREHSDYMGKTFVRMEPNVDFFVRLRREEDGTTTNSADSRPIFHQTWVSNNTKSGIKSKGNFKRRWNPNNNNQIITSKGNREPDMDIYRFGRPSTGSSSTDESIVMERVTVQVYEAAAADPSHHQARRDSSSSEATTGSRKRNNSHSHNINNRQQHPSRRNQKLLQAISIYCCVLPNRRQPSSGDMNPFTQDVSLLKTCMGGQPENSLAAATSLKRKALHSFPTENDISYLSPCRITPEKVVPTKLRRLVL